MHILYEQFAGAAQSLGAGALLVNPWNITEVAAAIGKALNMSDEEREKRHQLNFNHVTEHTAQEWAEFFVRYVNVDLFSIHLCSEVLGLIAFCPHGTQFHHHRLRCFNTCMKHFRRVAQ